jgi:hypothetical protein
MGGHGERTCVSPRLRSRRPPATNASSTGSANHASAQADLKLTFDLDHSLGADQFNQETTTNFWESSAPESNVTGEPPACPSPAEDVGKVGTRW